MLNTTASFELAEALTVTGDALSRRSRSALNEMVWFAFCAVTLTCTTGAGLKLAFPAWLNWAAQAVVPLVAVLVTASPEPAVAATGNELLYTAEGGGAVVTAMVWSAFTAATFTSTCGAGLKLVFPAWLKRTTQPFVPLVMVTVPPAMEQPPVVVIAMGSPELAVAATGNELRYAADAGGAVTVAMSGRADCRL